MKRKPIWPSPTNIVKFQKPIEKIPDDPRSNNENINFLNYQIINVIKGNQKTHCTKHRKDE